MITVYPAPPPALVRADLTHDNGKGLAVGAGLGIEAGILADPVRVYAVANETLLGAFAGRQPIRQMTWVLNGDIAFISGGDSTLHILAPQAADESHFVKHFSSDVLSIAASPSGDRVAVTDDRNVRVYKVKYRT